MPDLKTRITACRLCTDRFAATKTAHQPRPIVWFAKGARILIAGQAPGARVQASGVPFDDPSGDRLRDWMGLSRADFYDQNRVAILPIAFCFPGYNAQGADLPPPPICAKSWHASVMAEFGQPDLMLLVGGYAHK
jgi:uracil-DNA glycosylase